jgi:toxin secretion/phage lysis holin
MTFFNWVFPDAFDKFCLFLGALFGALFQFAFGEMTNGLLWLVCFSIGDWMTGTFAAIRTGELNSDAGRTGIMRKVVMFAFVSLAHGLDISLADLGFTSFSFMSLTITALMVNEAVSIVENFDRAGLAGFVPVVIRQSLKTIREAAEQKIINMDKKHDQRRD